MNRVGLSLFAVLSLSLAAPASAAVIGAGAIKVADTATAMPGGGGNFSHFSAFDAQISVPALDGNNVVFHGINADSTTRGVYSYIGGTLNLVANNATPIPGFAGNFTSFRTGDIGGSDIVFRGSGSGGNPTGVYGLVGGTLVRYLDDTMASPSGGIFQGYSVPVMNNGSTTVFADCGTPEGVYRITSAGAISIIADTGTSIPSGSGAFEILNCNIALSGNNVAFYGSSNNFAIQRGIYKSVGGSRSKVADRNTASPSGAGNFTGFDNSNIAMDGADVVFLGSDPSTASGADDIYAQVNGVLRRIARTGQARPGGGTHAFNNLTSVSLDDGVIVFSDGGDGSLFAHYLNTSATVKVIGLGDQLLGKTVSSLRYGENGQSGNNIALWASFTDGSSGIYIVPIPEPAMLTLLPMIMLTRRSRSRPCRN